MPDKKISQDETVLPGVADFVPILQAGANKKSTIQSIIDLVTLGSSPTVESIGALIGSADDAVPNDADYVSTAETGGGVMKKITWTATKAFLKTYFDSLYQSAL